MTTWTVILFAVALVWTLLLAVISVIFADKERNEREDLQKQKETLRYLEDKVEQKLQRREADIEEKARVLARRSKELDEKLEAFKIKLAEFDKATENLAKKEMEIKEMEIKWRGRNERITS